MRLSQFRKTVLMVAAAAALAAAQTANPKTPQPKSQKELEAIQAVFQAQDVNGRITAINNLITKFADTEFKATVLFVGAETYRMTGDIENMIIWSERTLEADPKFYGAMLQIASGLAIRTREFDLDKEEKLGRSEKMAKEALALLEAAPKPRADIPDEQWAAIKKDFEAQAYESMGTAMMVRKKHEDALALYNKASAAAANPDPALLVRLGNAASLAGKYDDAIAAFDKALAVPDASPQVKKIATDEKLRAIEKKKAAAPKQ
jgi:tetratricopeptide (TPR) repeat protein